jgi:hypothetical protein
VGNHLNLAPSPRRWHSRRLVPGASPASACDQAEAWRQAAAGEGTDASVRRTVQYGTPLREIGRRPVVDPGVAGPDEAQRGPPVGLVLIQRER